MLYKIFIWWDLPFDWSCRFAHIYSFTYLKLFGSWVYTLSRVYILYSLTFVDLYLTVLKSSCSLTSESNLSDYKTKLLTVSIINLFAHPRFSQLTFRYITLRSHKIEGVYEIESKVIYWFNRVHVIRLWKTALLN